VLVITDRLDASRECAKEVEFKGFRVCGGRRCEKGQADGKISFSVKSFVVLSVLQLLNERCCYGSRKQQQHKIPWSEQKQTNRFGHLHNGMVANAIARGSCRWFGRGLSRSSNHAVAQLCARGKECSVPAGQDEPSARLRPQSC